MSLYSYHIDHYVNGLISHWTNIHRNPDSYQSGFFARSPSVGWVRRIFLLSGKANRDRSYLEWFSSRFDKGTLKPCLESAWASGPRADRVCA